MGTMNWELRHTGRPFGPAEKLEPEHFKHIVSKHTTLSAARKRQDQELADMHRACGQNAWDNHFAVFPLRPTMMHIDAECSVCGTWHTVHYTWQPGEFNHGIDLQNSECPECKARRAGMTDVEAYRDYETHRPKEYYGYANA